MLEEGEEVLETLINCHSPLKLAARKLMEAFNGHIGSLTRVVG